jgi:hypothetical protein
MTADMTKKSVKLIIRDICTRFWFAAVAMPAVSLSAGTFVVTLLNLAAVADEDDGGTTAAPAAAPE